MDRNIKLALILLGITLVWVGSGLFFGTDKPAGEGDAAPAFTVEVLHSEATDYHRHLRIRGQSEPHRVVALRAEIGGRIAELPHPRGAALDEGDLVCRLAEEDRRQRLDQASSALELARLEYEGVVELRRTGLQSDIQEARAKADIDRARAELRLRQVAVENLEIRAPFAGALEDRPVEQGDFLQPGQLCGRVVETDPLKVVAHLPAARVLGMAEGGLARVHFGNGEPVVGDLVFVASTADPETRTYRTEILVDNSDRSLRAGQAVTVELPLGTVAAHHLASSVLTLGAGGELGVFRVDERNRARFVPVEVVGESDKGIWLSGLPASARVITRGQEYIADGQEVATVAAGEPG